MPHHFLTHLRERDLVAQASHEEELSELLTKGTTSETGKPHAVYCGFDPTARSLHVGNLAGIMNLRRAQDCGLVPVVLFGGATGLVGDPTGRTEMRPMNTREQIGEFIENFKRLVGRYFRFDVPNAPVFVNNIDWLGGMTWIDFAREVGVHFTVARLLAADVNRTRFEGGGLTFMELSYQLMQAYDFLHLSRTQGCIVQIGGNDQWSNILAGADLIRRVDGRKAFALTFPLLVGADGRKYGKTAGNAIWLDAAMTSPYDFYQFFRNIPDADIALIMRNFTFASPEEIRIRCDGSRSDINQTKQDLAFEITKLVHGDEAARQALDAAKALFSGGGDLKNAPTTLVTRAEIGQGMDILSLLVKCGLAASRGEGRKLIQGNGLSVNNERMSDAAHVLKLDDFANAPDGLLLRKGKKDFHLVRLADA